MRILFLGDKSQNLMSWVNALEANDRDLIRVWSMKRSDRGTFSRLKRFYNIILSPIKVNKIIKEFNPDLLIGYRIPSYGFISVVSGHKPVIVAAQGASDLWPLNSKILWLKRFML